MRYKKKPKIVIHVDGGNRVGYGHMTRGLGLAHGLKREGVDPILTTHAFNKQWRYMSHKGFPVILGPSTATGLKKLCDVYHAQGLVLDSYRVQVGKIKKQLNGLPLAYFHDVGQEFRQADMVINGSPSAASFSYTATGNQKFLLGPRFQILKPEFLKTQTHPRHGQPKRLIVTLGGGPAPEILESLYKTLQGWIDCKWPWLEATFIVSAATAWPRTRLKRPFKVKRNPNNLPTLFRQADLAISAGGQTLYELAWCGVPTIAVCLGKDQWKSLQWMARAGCVRSAGDVHSPDWLNRLERELTRMLQDGPLRRELSSKGCRLIDGQGAYRIAHEIKKNFLQN